MNIRNENGDLIGSDEMIFDRLYTRHASALMRIARRHCGGFHTAEDVVQETWLRVWRAKASIKHTESELSWLVTIMKNEYARLFSRKMATVPMCGEDALEITACSDDVERSVLVVQVIGQMGGESHPLILENLIGYSQPEIANKMCISENALRIRNHRERKRLYALHCNALAA